MNAMTHRFGLARTLAALLVTAGVTLPVPLTCAQPANQPTELAPGESMLPRLDFPGGTIEEFVAKLKQSSRVPFNLIVHPSAAGAPVPPITIENSEPISAAQALQSLTFIRDQAVWELIVRFDSNPYGGVSSVLAQRTSDPVGAAAVRTTTEVLDLSRAVMSGASEGQGLTLEDVLAAVTTTVQQASEDNSTRSSPFAHDQASQRVNAKISLHRETNLLIITGSTDQIRAANQVVERLQARQQEPTTVVETSLRTTEADREWFMSQLVIAMRNVDNAVITSSDVDKSLIIVKVPQKTKPAVELLARYLQSADVQAQRIQRTLEVTVERTRLETAIQSLERELALTRQAQAVREGELRNENQQLREQLQVLRSQIK